MLYLNDNNKFSTKNIFIDNRNFYLLRLLLFTIHNAYFTTQTLVSLIDLQLNFLGI